MEIIFINFVYEIKEPSNFNLQFAVQNVAFGSRPAVSPFASPSAKLNAC